MPSFNPAAVRAITFDLYGTLLDLEATFAPAFDGFLRERRVDADAAEFVRTWEWAYLHEGMVDTFIGGPRTPFERLRRTTLSQVLARMGIEHSRDDIEDLLAVRAMPTLFPDVVESLNAMRGRYTLSVLSNGDLSVLERIVSTLDIPVHRTISVEQAGCYKPDLRGFNTALERMRCDKEQWLHIGESLYHDIGPANRMDIASVWVNRPDRGGGTRHTDATPDLVVSDLAELAGIMRSA